MARLRIVVVTTIRYSPRSDLQIITPFCAPTNALLERSWVNRLAVTCFRETRNQMTFNYCAKFCVIHRFRANRLEKVRISLIGLEPKRKFTFFHSLKFSNFMGRIHKQRWNSNFQIFKRLDFKYFDFHSSSSNNTIPAFKLKFASNFTIGYKNFGSTLARIFLSNLQFSNESFASIAILCRSGGVLAFARVFPCMT